MLNESIRVAKLNLSFHLCKVDTQVKNFQLETKIMTLFFSHQKNHIGTIKNYKY